MVKWKGGLVDSHVFQGRSNLLNLWNLVEIENCTFWIF